jgi:hypothetical protein
MFIPLGILLLCSISSIRKLKLTNEVIFILILAIVCAVVRFMNGVEILTGSKRYMAPLLIFLIIAAVPGFFILHSWLSSFFKKKQFYILPCLVFIIIIVSVAKALNPPTPKKYIHFFANTIKNKINQDGLATPVIIDGSSISNRIVYYLRMPNKVKIYNNEQRLDKKIDETSFSELNNNFKNATSYSDGVFLVFRQKIGELDFRKEYLARNNYFPFELLEKVRSRKKIYYLYYFNKNQHGNNSMAGGVNVKLLLPPAVYATLGEELKIYYNNICLVNNIKNYRVKIAAQHGKQYDDYWLYIPNKKDEGFKLEISILNNFNLPIAKTVTTVKINSREKLDKKVIVIGDNSYGYEFALKNIMKTHHAIITFIKPSKDDSENIITKFCYNKVINKEDKLLLSTDKADMVIINGSLNNLFVLNDYSREQYLKLIVNNIRQLIQKIRLVNEDIKIGISLGIPPAASQTLFGMKYGCTITQWQFRRNHHRLVEMLIDTFSKQQNISLIPLYVNLDTKIGFGYFSKDLNTITGSPFIPNSIGCQSVEKSFLSWIMAQ